METRNQIVLKKFPKNFYYPANVPEAKIQSLSDTMGKHSLGYSFVGNRWVIHTVFDNAADYMAHLVATKQISEENAVRTLEALLLNVEEKHVNAKV